MTSPIEWKKPHPNSSYCENFTSFGPFNVIFSRLCISVDAVLHELSIAIGLNRFLPLFSFLQLCLGVPCRSIIYCNYGLLIIFSIPLPLYIQNLRNDVFETSTYLLTNWILPFVEIFSCILISSGLVAEIFSHVTFAFCAVMYLNSEKINH